MSNNPGKKGKLAPWQRRAQEHKIRSEEQYRRDHHPAYAAYAERRSEAFRNYSQEAEIALPGMHQIYDCIKLAHKSLSKWDKANLSPLSFDEHLRLKAEFSAQYIAPDFS